MELTTLRILETALCATKPTWSLRLLDGTTIIRFTQTLDDDVSGFLCYSLNGLKCVKSFTVYPNALPAKLAVGKLLAYFINRLNEEAKVPVVFLSWSEDAKHIKVAANRHVLTVGTEIIATEWLDTNGIIVKSISNDEFDDSVKKLTSIAFLQNGYYRGPLPQTPVGSLRIKRVKLKGCGDREGVFLTEALGQSIAKNEKLDESFDNDVVFIEFPLETTIVTAQFLQGLLLEVFCQCGAVGHFKNRYRLVGVGNLNVHVTSFIEEALKIKQHRKSHV